MPYVSKGKVPLPYVATVLGELVMRTVTASEAPGNFSKRGEEIAHTREAVAVFRKSRPWFVRAHAQAEKEDALAQGARHYLGRYRRP